MEAPVSSFSPTRFSNFEAHTLGGNRAPFWQVVSSNKKDASFGARHEYYKKTDSIGDFKVDDKYKEIFSGGFIEEVEKFEDYLSLCKTLGYSKVIAK